MDALELEEAAHTCLDLGDMKDAKVWRQIAALGSKLLPSLGGQLIGSTVR